MYRAWRDMIQRCHNKNNHAYCDYGARGVTVCDKWRGKGGFVAFYEHIGNQPDNKEDWSVDRIDNNKGYGPGNVRWATAKDQANNRREPRDVSPRNKPFVVEVEGKRVEFPDHYPF